MLLNRRRERTPAREYLPCPLRPDTRHARNVVNGITAQGQQVRHQFRPHAQLLLHVLRPVPLLLPRVEHAHPAADKLNMPGIGYQLRAAERAWRQMQAFFDELFAPSGKGSEGGEGRR